VRRRGPFVAARVSIRSLHQTLHTPQDIRVNDITRADGSTAYEVPIAAA
jgi:hypothetical protein